MATSQLVVIVVVAMVAGVILFRLYSVLGRRTGHERDPRERMARWGGGAADGLTRVPPRTPPAGEIATVRPMDETAQGLLDIKLADRNFETDHFLTGAKKAHELIVAAYAKGDRSTLRPLVSDEVFAAFDAALKAREQRREQMKFTLVSYRNVNITHAALKGRTAEVTVTFQVQVISSTTDAEGKIIEGDPSVARDITDVWTFARDTGARDPNWSLIATSGEI